MLRPEILNKVPFDTVDGTSWFRTARFARRNGMKLDSDYVREKRYDLIYLELLEHIEFQNEMRRKWSRYVESCPF